jgi:nucleotide-binding universal stress UspA family protein
VTTTRHPVQVVVAYDFSPSSEQALRAAIDLAARETHHVLHIAGILDPHDRVTIGEIHELPTYETAEKIQKLIAEHTAAAFAGRPTHGDVQFHVHARIGKAAHEILELAQDVGADLIYIGSHGKSGVERLLLGSVSERVAREAKCPVMVVRPKTYPAVTLVKVTEYEHTRTPHREPHTYTYTNQQVVLRPSAWPIG